MTPRKPPAQPGDISTCCEGSVANVVRLCGRVSVDPVATTLPSGDVVVSIRLVVDRGEKARKPPYVDTIDCSAWTARIRRTVLTWHEADEVAVEGALRRRFWRGSTGTQSRYEVEITGARRLERAMPSRTRA